jgi:hypothetical protein
MIRERISTQGIVRPLEHEDDLPAFTIPSDRVGVMPNSVIQRYLACKKDTEKKFASILNNIENQRARQVERAGYELAQRAAALRPHLSGRSSNALPSTWRLAWALDAGECPPPSSIAGRLDTEEALQLIIGEDQVSRVAGEYATGPSQCPLKSGVAAMTAVLFAAKMQRAKMATNGGDEIQPDSGT